MVAKKSTICSSKTKLEGFAKSKGKIENGLAKFPNFAVTLFRQQNIAKFIVIAKLIAFHIFKLTAHRYFVALLTFKSLLKGGKKSKSSRVLQPVEWLSWSFQWKTKQHFQLTFIEYQWPFKKATQKFSTQYLEICRSLILHLNRCPVQ